MKVLITIFLLLINVYCNAQTVESLVYQKIEPDPMTNQAGGVSWVGEHIYIHESNKGETSIVLYNPEHIFVRGKRAKLGYYTKNDSLIGMATDYMPWRLEDGRRMLITAALSQDTIPYG